MKSNMDVHEIQTLETLRIQNLSLLEKLRTGQEKCKSIVYGGDGKPGILPSKHPHGNKVKSPKAPDTRQYTGILSNGHEHDSSLFSYKIGKSPESFKIKTYESPGRSPGITKRDAYKPALDTSVYSADGSLSRDEPSPLRRELYQDSSPQSYSQSDKNLTSTPNQSILSVSKTDTPKSILKRRKIIEDNVKVESKYAHTPTPTPTHTSRKKQGLNFSYTDVDDLDLALEKASKRSPSSLIPPSSSSLSHSRNYSSPTDGSYIEEYLDTSVSDLKSEERMLQTGTSESQDNRAVNSPRQNRQNELLKDSGNERKQATIVTNFSQRPKSVVFSTETTESENTRGKQKKRRSPERNSKSSQGGVSQHDLPPALDSRLQPPLLGYDWIAGILDNEEALYTMPEHFYDEIRNFRRTYKQDCISNPYSSNPLGLTKPLSPVVRDPTHTCIHGYDVNKRLFTEPVNADDDGRSLCPVCMQARKEPNPGSPGFVRVSIPKSALGSPYERRPHRRGSFDSADSCALSKHCLAGWECSKPSMLPTASTVDLQQAAKGIRAKQSTTMEDTEKVAASYSRFSKLTSRPRPDLSMTSTTNDEKPTSTGDGVLNRSRALEWELREAPRDPPYIKRR